MAGRLQNDGIRSADAFVQPAVTAENIAIA